MQIIHAQLRHLIPIIWTKVQEFGPVVVPELLYGQGNQKDRQADSYELTLSSL